MVENFLSKYLHVLSFNKFYFFSSYVVPIITT